MTLMRQQNWDGSMLHDMAGHAAEQELPVMAMCVGAHDDETRLVRAGVSKQARAYRTYSSGHRFLSSSGRARRTSSISPRLIFFDSSSNTAITA